MRINVYVEMPDEDVQLGWGGDLDELEKSIAAALRELVGDDGGAYVPRVLGCDFDEEVPS